MHSPAVLGHQTSVSMLPTMVQLHMTSSLVSPQTILDFAHLLLLVYNPWHCVIVDVFIDTLPLTPPSSTQNSDSEGGGASPQQSPPSSPVRQVLVARAGGTGAYRYNPATAIYSQPVCINKEHRKTVSWIFGLADGKFVALQFKL